MVLTVQRRVWQFLDEISGVQVCRLILQKSQVCNCADLVLNMCEKLVDKYISNICPQRANSFEHVDVLCGLGAALYNLLTCGAVNTISSNLGLQIFKNFLSPPPKCPLEFSRKFLGCALAKLCRLTVCVVINNRFIHNKNVSA